MSREYDTVLAIDLPAVSVIAEVFQVENAGDLDNVLKTDFFHRNRKHYLCHRMMFLRSLDTFYQYWLIWSLTF